MEIPQPALGLPRWSSSESQGHRAAAVCGEEPVGTARGSAVTPRVLWETTAGEEGQPPASKAPWSSWGESTAGGGVQSGCGRPVGSRTEVEAGTGVGAAVGGGLWRKSQQDRMRV